MASILPSKAVICPISALLKVFSLTLEQNACSG
jgi:hypothetical protein